MIYLAMPVGCRVNNSLRCADGMCVPPTVTCDGVQYCKDGSTFDLLCGEFCILHDNCSVYGILTVLIYDN